MVLLEHEEQRRQIRGILGYVSLRIEIKFGYAESLFAHLKIFQIDSLSLKHHINENSKLTDDGTERTHVLEHLRLDSEVSYN